MHIGYILAGALAAAGLWANYEYNSAQGTMVTSPSVYYVLYAAAVIVVIVTHFA
jgi:hypothetical protein